MLKVAYFSPFNPIRSGVSDYSEELLPHLAKKLKIDLFAADYELSNQAITEQFPVYKIKEFEQRNNSAKYDVIIYHIGNNEIAHEEIYYQALKFPGIIVMHDYALHHMVAALTLKRGKVKDYIEEMNYCHGNVGLEKARAYLDGYDPPPWETEPLKFSINKRVVESALGIIVHSFFTANLLKANNTLAPIKVVRHHCANITKNTKTRQMEAKQALNIKNNELMIASFGFVNKSKRIEKILTALAELFKEGYEFNYYLVGKVEPDVDIELLIKKKGLPRERIKVTGFLKLEEFINYMHASDICLNLRYPVYGETSGSLQRLLGMGKPVIVNNYGSFSEYPGDVVVKIDVFENEEKQLYESLKMLFSLSVRETFGRNAQQYARERLMPEHSADNYIDFIQKVHANDCLKSELVELAAGLISDLGLEDNERLITDIADAIHELSCQF